MIHTNIRAIYLLLGFLFSFSSCLSSDTLQQGAETYTTLNDHTKYEKLKDTSPQKSSLFKNRCVVTFISAAGAIATTIALAVLSQDFDPNASQQFLNQTTIYDSMLGTIPDADYQRASMRWQNFIVPDSECYHSFMNYDTSFWNHSRFSGDPYRGPSYLLWDESGRGRNIKGNLSEWITVVANKGPCDFDALYQYVTSVFSATNLDPEILICTRNNNNATTPQTMCCSGAWTKNSSLPEKHWRPHNHNDMSLRIVSGSGPCAQNAEDARWTRNMGLAGGIGAVATLLPWAISWFC